MRSTPWRVVEAQHQVWTRKLVDSTSEQELLEELIDRVKPPDSSHGKSHYLLFTPFRYPPLRHGSRFGTKLERGIWYGAEEHRTAFAEIAYYRLLFLEGTRAQLDLVTTALTAFTVRMHSSRGIDLTLLPFSTFQDEISSPTRYGESQILGREMREAGVEFFRFASARDPEHGTAIGAFTPAVFHHAQPQRFETWHCTASRQLVDFSRGDFRPKRQTFSFERAQFAVDGVLPSPAL